MSWTAELTQVKQAMGLLRWQHQQTCLAGLLSPSVCVLFGGGGVEWVSARFRLPSPRNDGWWCRLDSTL